jgi:hypothetical protein
MKKQGGAIALLIAITLIIAVGTPLLLHIIEAAVIKASWPGETSRKLTAIDDAIAAFVSSQRRLPCPADGAISSSVAGVGSEARIAASGDCTAAQVRGVVPWLTLGLSEADATDAWGGRFTYRVWTGPTGLTQDNAMDATFCDPVGTKPAPLMAGLGNNTAACFNTCLSAIPPALLNPSTCNNPALFLSNRGLIVRNALGVAIRNPAANLGAAYVVISHGPEGGGAYNATGALTSSSIAPGANGEVRNLNNQAVPGVGLFHDAAIRSGTDAGADHFDDVMSFPTISDLLAKTGLGARNH